MLLRKIMSLACAAMLYSSYSVHAHSIHKNDFTFEIRKSAQSYINSLPEDKTFDIRDIPAQLKSEYEGCLANAKERLDDILWNRSGFYLDHTELDRITKQEVDKFVKTMSSIALEYNLDKKINNAICDLMHKNSITKLDIEKHAANEYDSRYYKVKDKLIGIMSRDHKTYVRVNEIEKAVSDEFLVLIKRVKNQAKAGRQHSSSQQTSGSWQDFWDWITGANSRVDTPSSEPSAPPYNYAGEKCSICLENIKSRERLGYLSCGHYFHEECIQTSLNSFGHKCPLCDTHTDRIAYTVVVPLQ